MNEIVRAASLQEVSEWTWREKYRHVEQDGSSLEHSISDTHRRVVRGVYANDRSPPGIIGHEAHAFNLMEDMIWCPAGRIHAGAGTGNEVTLINCYVSPYIEDSMRTNRNQNSKGIGDALNVAMWTQQMGGGIGMDFSTLRPNLAIVKRTNSVSTGPLPFMGMWDAMCKTVKSSGSRRGAMMAVMRCDHPDIFAFVRAKHTKGVFENFNVSVLVTDAFMRAKEADLDWDLVFDVPRADGNHVAVYPSLTEHGKFIYVYERIKARALWEEITRSTYEFAEPGVIYIDRVNEWNNLYYCEYLHATNPCGEQPLPDNGACNLGAINLARLVKDPFRNPTFMGETLGRAAQVGMRFLDNVLDVSKYPTEEQYIEAMNKRRTGLGITGLGNALQQMQIRYGSDQAVRFTEDVMRTLRDEAYRESIELAKERGPFPMFDKDKYLKAKFVQTLPEDIQQGIAEHGIRNGVLLTIAPTGTTSMYYGNVSSGLEPTFAWKYNRKALEHDGSYREFKEVRDYGYLLYKEIVGHEEGEKLPDYMVSAMELTVKDHLVMQAICQKYIDASISKTINCPADMPFEEFEHVYTMAYEMGCKGCTTYRPSGVRGSVLSVEEKAAPAEQPIPTIKVAPRDEELEGTTYKVKYPGVDQAFYITLNDYVDEFGVRRPFEIFINSKSVKHQEWVTALTRMLSAIFRRGGDVTFIVEELNQVHSANGGVFVKGRYVPSFVAFLGSVIEKHFNKIGLLDTPAGAEVVIVPTQETSKVLSAVKGDVCPSCEAPTMTKQEGCEKCTSCGYSSCG